MTRKTLSNSVKVRGIGLHSGEKVTVWLHPAEAGSGIKFRVGNGRHKLIPALVPFVVETRRRIVLGKDGASVQTVEHLLASCFGMGITDLLVEVHGGELPVGDGSAQIWVDAFKDAGLTDLGEPAPLLVPNTVVTVEATEGVWVKVEPSDRFCAHYVFVTEHPMVGTQEASFDSQTDDFVSEIAPARTFGFWEEVSNLWEQGLAKGGQLDNALVVFPDRYSSPLRFPNELARHKLLDLMGDLALLGARIQAKVCARSSGHTLHLQLCQVLWQ